MSEKPLISIILPVYNAEQTITKTLNSILSQTYENLEILIYDDASTDRTRSIILSIINNETKAKLFNFEENKGVGYARNYLLQRATGEYFAFLDADDHWSQTKIERQIKYMMKGDLGICCCHYNIFDEKEKLVGFRKPPEEITYTKMHFANWLPMSMTMVKSSLLGSKDMPLLRRRQDYAYWLNIFRLNKDVKCRTISDNLGSYTRRQNSLSSSKKENMKYNFMVFHGFMGYTKAFAVVLVLMNIVTRITRT